MWAIAERCRFTGYSSFFAEDVVIKLAREWQLPQKALAYPAMDHDQGFRFMPTYKR